MFHKESSQFLKEMLFRGTYCVMTILACNVPYRNVRKSSKREREYTQSHRVVDTFVHGSETCFKTCLGLKAQNMSAKSNSQSYKPNT
jgi:hypothetical protein